jgi:hypothetical protein
VSVGAPSAKIDWEAEGVRFTAFPPPSVTFEPKPLWDSLLGKAPEEVQERPAQGVRNEFGPFLDDNLFLTQQLSRIDFLLGVHPQKAPTMDFVSTGRYARAEPAFSELVKKWLKSAPSLGRIAYAPMLVHQVESVEKSYDVFRHLLPALPVDDKARNVLWQVNRPRASRILKDITINRLSKWSCFTVERFQLVQDTKSFVPGPMASVHGIKLEFDIYTDPIQPIPAECLTPLFEELMSAVNEIIEQGDV